MFTLNYAVEFITLQKFPTVYVMTPSLGLHSWTLVQEVRGKSKQLVYSHSYAISTLLTTQCR
jgi:hypothetical protein